MFSRVIYVGDPKLIKKIANENWPKFPAQYAGFKPLSGSALFAQMDQERWKMQRKGLAPAFQPRAVNDQYQSLHRYLLVSRRRSRAFRCTCSLNSFSSNS